MAYISVTIPVTLEEQPVHAPHTRLQQGLESTGREVTDVSDQGGGSQSIHHVVLPACSKETASESWAGNLLPGPIRPLSHSEAAAVTRHGAGVGPVHKLIPEGEAGPLTQSTEDKSLLPSSVLEGSDSALECFNLKSRRQSLLRTLMLNLQSNSPLVLKIMYLLNKKKKKTGNTGE